MLQAQLRFWDGLMLLSRHAARESQSARSVVELLSIQMNLQNALAIDCAAFASECMSAGGLPGGALRADQRDHRRVGAGEAPAPVIGALTEPIIEGMETALFAAMNVPSQAIDGRAPRASLRAAAPGGRVEAASRPAARARAEPPARRREPAKSVSPADKKPQARREPEPKQRRERRRK